MRVTSFYTRVHEYGQRRLSRHLGIRPIDVRLTQPIVSFTFDDFPISAFRAGGSILEEFGATGTYYVALDLLGRRMPVGMIASIDDLQEVVARGHELGCHTFTHCHAWKTHPRLFEESILDNRLAFAQVMPGVPFETHSYPISTPHPRTKLIAGKYFACCRGGGQTFNAGRVDLNRLNAFFLEKSRSDLAAVKGLIDRNKESRGWLIFVTHDISEEPTNFGCTPEFLREVVKYSLQSGAAVLPVAKALRVLQSDRGGIR